MPEISRFYGIVIAMFAKDHIPPHFHAKYSDHIAYISIETGEILVGFLPLRAERLVKEWTQQHRNELIENWKESQKDNPQFKKIKPLE